MPTPTIIEDAASGSTVTIDGTQTNTQTVEVQNVTGSGQENATLPLDASHWIGFRFNSTIAGASLVWATATAWISASLNLSDTATLSFALYSDSGGLPGTVLGAIGSTHGNAVPTSGALTAIEVASPAAGFPGIANSTFYWLVLEFSSSVAGTYAVAYDNSTGNTGIVATSSNGGSTWGTIAGTGYYQLGAGTGHSVIGSTPTGRGVSGSTINGQGVYGEATGAKGAGGYFVGGPLGYGVQIIATNPAVTNALDINNGQMYVDPAGQIYTPGIRTATRVTTGNTTLDATDSTVAVNASNKTVTLPAASANAGRMYKLLTFSGATGTIVGSNGGNVQGGATDTTTLAAALAHATYQAISGNWYVV